MVKGIDIFIDHFSKFNHCYAVIGGTACHLILAEAGLDFRATKDIDIVICLEEFDSAFSSSIREFINKGKYSKWESNDGKKHYYRFVNPENDGFPFMLELLSIIPDAIEIADGSRFTSLPTDDELSSLSAILMDNEYYQLVLDGKTELNGLSIVSAEYLIPLKIKAWIDLTDKKKSGNHVNSDDIKKHRNDVFRLSRLLTPTTKIELADTVKTDMRQGFDRLKELDISLASFKMGNTTVAEVVDRLSSNYGLTE